jgi:hypothetical protein
MIGKALDWLVRRGGGDSRNLSLIRPRRQEHRLGVTAFLFLFGATTTRHHPPVVILSRIFASEQHLSLALLALAGVLQPVVGLVYLGNLRSRSEDISGKICDSIYFALHLL